MAYFFNINGFVEIMTDFFSRFFFINGKFKRIAFISIYYKSKMFLMAYNKIGTL